MLCLAALVKVAVARNHEELAGPLRHDRRVGGASTAAAAAAASRRAAAPALASDPADLPAARRRPRRSAADACAHRRRLPALRQLPTRRPRLTASGRGPARRVTDRGCDRRRPTGGAPPDPKEAAKDKHASQLALERGKVGDAIDAGERSVALDPSDAEAWLILGAAYQEKGDQKNARRCFKSCLEQGKRGPKWECAQFPH